MSQGKASKIMHILLETMILIFLFFIFMTNLFHFNYGMNADTASDAVLAKLIWTSKEIIPHTWYIAAETRIIGTPDFAALFYGLTGNMALSEGMACCLMTLFIMAGIVYFGKKAELSRTEIDLLVLLGLSIPVNMIILELLYLFASYYAIHVAILFFTLGVYTEGIKGKIKPVPAGISIVFALCLGMQGVRGILILYGPLFGIEIIRTVYRMYCRAESRKMDWITSIWVTGLLIISFVGTCFPFSEGQEFSRNIRKGFLKLFTEVLPDAKKAIGLSAGSTLRNIFIVSLLVILLCMLVNIIYCMWKKESIDEVYWAFLLLCASPVVTALIISFTTFADSERYYFLLIYTMALAVVLMRKKISNKWKVVGEVLILFFLIINVCTVYRPIMNSPEPPATNIRAVGEYLEENNYHVAYTTFENANRITVLTNGGVQAAAVASVEKMDICKWMTSTLWYVPNMPFEERTAYIIPESELENFKVFLKEHKNEVDFVQKIGEYSIYASNYNFSVIE